MNLFFIKRIHVATPGPLLATYSCSDR
eukprot:COSAG02_NODE_46618_length_347_cov_1.004032_1_plen_26_part_01